MTVAERLKNPHLWRESCYDLFIWFLAGLTMCQALAMYTPGYPILVGTPSIKTGIYWLDKNPGYVAPGQFITFPFEPAQDWLQGRYGDHGLHTKQLLGENGATVTNLGNGKLLLCPGQRYDGITPPCVDAGTAQTQDSRGRPLRAWVEEGKSYTLASGEIWVYGEHPRSLDSRYHGPIRKDIIRGRATPLIHFKMGE